MKGLFKIGDFSSEFPPVEVRLARSPTSAALTPSSSSSFRHASSGQEKDTAAKLGAVKRGKRSVAHPRGEGGRDSSNNISLGGGKYFVHDHMRENCVL